MRSKNALRRIFKNSCLEREGAKLFFSFSNFLLGFFIAIKYSGSIWIDVTQNIVLVFLLLAFNSMMLRRVIFRTSFEYNSTEKMQLKLRAE